MRRAGVIIRYMVSSRTVVLIIGLLVVDRKYRMVVNRKMQPLIPVNGI